MLGVGGCHKLTDVSLIEVARRCSRLHYLVVVGCGRLTDAAFIAIAKGCPKLDWLDATNCRKLTSASDAALEQHCRQVFDGLSSGSWRRCHNHEDEEDEDDEPLSAGASPGGCTAVCT